MKKITEIKQSPPVAIITGASRGIGRELAIGIAQDGFNLVMIARSGRALQSVLNEVEDLSPTKTTQHTIHSVDVSDDKLLTKVVANTMEKYGKIDLLINNAGVYTPGTLDIPIQSFEQMVRVNLTGPFVLMKAVIPIMKEQKFGHVINIASRAGKIGFEGDGAYGASKFGLVGLNESLYRELAKCGISLTAICPSWVKTEMAEGAPMDGSEMIQPSDILKTVRWLLNLSPSVRVRELILECRNNVF
jgi:short-subunit dehydrogenase